jgi:hypothetical protein
MGRRAVEGVIQKSGRGRRVGGCFILTEWGLGSERGDEAGGSPLRATAVPTLLKRINPTKKPRTNLYDNEDCCNTVYATRYRQKNNSASCYSNWWWASNVLSSPETDWSLLRLAGMLEAPTTDTWPL